MIRRRFADLPGRQVHYREAGEGPPLLMLHASPGSSKQLETKMTALARTRRVIAPDTPGNGDSTPLPLASPQITDYAAALVLFLDAVGLEQCDVYGSHTGAHIAMELAVLAPDRIRKVVLDGFGVFSEEDRAHYLANYALQITPDINGHHLLTAHMFCRDQYLFWPWFERGAANRRAGGLPTPEVLHDWVLEVCKSITTYHLSYRAAFAHRPHASLARMAQQTQFLVAENDPLLADTKVAATLPANGQLGLMADSGAPGFADALAATMNTFLDA